MRRMIFVLTLSLVGLFVLPFSFWGRGVLAAGGKDYAFMANNLANLLVSARLIVARNQDVINTHGARLGKPIPEDAPSLYKGFVPEIFGRLVAEEFTSRTGISVKQTTLGKGRGSRNVYNAPDAWEKATLQKFSARSYPKGVGFGEFVDMEEGSQGTVYRYMLPLYIEATCLQCHGDPQRPAPPATALT
ncbi:MAG: DUF3365 domain-containing protein [Candidatus Brocadiaceae bacterium]|nr:DUF3365 domain-containing protein [Candidatus Brocadiaceae bacterium]